MCQQVVLFVNLIGQLTNVAEPFLILLMILMIQMVHLMQHAVDEWQDAHDLRDLRTLFHVASLRLLDSHSADAQLIGLQLQQVVELMVLFALLIEIVEQPQQEQ